MELVVSTTELAGVLRLVQTLADRKNTLPVLGTLLLRADTKGLFLTGTDLEAGGMVYCPAIVKAPGSIAVPAQRLSEYVRLLPEGELLLRQQTSGWLSVASGRSRSRIAVMDAAQYPELPKPLRDGFTFPTGTLVRLVEKALIASAESANPAGALLKIGKDSLTMVATDGHRLALASAPLPQPQEKTTEVLIPRKTLTAFLRFAETRQEQPVRCTVTDHHLFFVWQERMLFSRRVSTTFPQYERVLPQKHAWSLALDRNEFRRSLERVAQFAETGSRCVMVELSPQQMTVRAENTAIGQSEEALPVSYGGEILRLGFNASYLDDFLSCVEGKEIQFLFNDADSAAELRPATDLEQLDFRYVVMPMRLTHSASSSSVPPTH